MKNIIVILFASLFILSCGTKPNDVKVSREHTDWEKFNLKGNVKSYREIKFLSVEKFRIISGGERVSHIYNKEVLFNLDGYKIEKNDYIPDGTLANRAVYLYKGTTLVEYNEYDSQGLLFGTGKFETSNKGQIESLEYRTNDGRYNWSEAYQYDDSKNLIEVKRFKTEEAIDTKETYVFDKSGKIIESEFYRDDKLVSINNYNYNEENNYSELIFGDSVAYTYKYNYDAKGNWIKKIVFENNNPSGILVREIEYFN